MGMSSWELYLLEHGLSKDGVRNRNQSQGASDNDTDTFTTFFDETEESKKYVPRAIMVDLEPSVIGNLNLLFVRNWLLLLKSFKLNIFSS